MNFLMSGKNVSTKVFRDRTEYCLLVIILALILGIIISFGIFTSLQILIFIVFVSLLVLGCNKPSLICLIAILLMFTPLSLGTVFRLKIIWAAEPVIVILFFLIIAKNMHPKRKSLALTISSNPLLIILLLYLIILIINYLRFPLPASSVVGIAAESGGIRFYYEKILMFLVFLSTAYLVEMEEKFLKRLTTVLLVMTAVVTAIGILIFMFEQIYEVIEGFQSAGVLADDSILTGGWYRMTDPFIGVTRTSILWITPLGILLLMSNLCDTKTLMKIILVVFFTVGLILSATRNFFFGVMVALMVWAILSEKKRMLFAFVAITVFAFLLFNLGLFSQQFNRLFYFPSNLERLTSFRYELFATYWSVFKQNILFGVGVGATEIGHRVPGTPEYFMMQNLRFGGHGFFLGTLYTQGIIGILPFCLLYFFGLKIAYKLFKANNSKYYRVVGLFVLIFIAYSFIPFLVGGTETYNQLFIVLGILAGVYARYRKIYGSAA